VTNGYEDFGLEPEHVEFRSQFRRFVADRLAPVARRGESERCFPLEIYDLLREAGYLGINYPEAIGGAGGDLLMGCLFYEELTRASAGVSAGVFAHQHLALGPIIVLGTPEQKAEFERPAIEGRRIGAFGLTEPDAGSDIRGIRTTARRNGDDFVLNGSKLYITNGTIADFMLIAARTGQARCGCVYDLHRGNRRRRHQDAQSRKNWQPLLVHGTRLHRGCSCAGPACAR
jgi:alkylation response protein AidB-like acyl-CoA dehydrogenase